MTKLIDSQQNLNDKIMNGVNKLADAVGVTLGPRGRNVLIKGKNLKPVITKDGVTVSRFFDLEDPFENLGAQVIKQAAESTVSSAGDGTTTATVLAQAILTNAQPYLSAGDSPTELKRGIELATKAVIAKIKEKAQPVQSLEQVEQIAIISANGEKAIGKLISIAVDKVGRDGAITIQEGRSSETTLDVTEGFTFDSGLLANAFVTDERRGVCRYEDCLMLVTDRTISTIDEILPILELAARDGRPFVIVAEQVEGQALAALIMNSAKGTMKVTAIKAPRYGEERRNILDDLSTIVGATFVSRESGLQFKQLKLANLGTAKIVETSKFSTTIVSNGKHQDKTAERIESLKSLIEKTQSLHEGQKVQERITRLASGIAVIKVGGSTEVDMIEKKHRIEDALEAVNSAQQEGIVAGGGCTLFRAATDLNVEVENETQRHGVEIVRQAIKEPFRKILTNAGMDPGVVAIVVLDQSEGYDSGYDVGTGTFCSDMVKAGIIDPLKVIRCALENASSAASTLLTTAVAIVEI